MTEGRLPQIERARLIELRERLERRAELIGIIGDKPGSQFALASPAMIV
jgi:hypothetical protein